MDCSGFEQSRYPRAMGPSTKDGHAARRIAGSAASVPEATALEAVRSLARASRLLERAAGDLGMAQYRVLSAIAAGDERASRVAKRFGLGRPTVSAAVDALCRQGLISRKESTGDHRVTDLSITDRGAVLLGEAEAAMVAVLDQLCKRSSTAAAVAAAFAALGPAIDAWQADRAGGTEKTSGSRSASGEGGADPAIRADSDRRLGSARR